MRVDPSCLAAGDLLRAEQTREGSQYGQMIKEYIKEGLIVPMEVTVKVRLLISSPSPLIPLVGWGARSTEGEGLNAEANIDRLPF